MATKRPAEDALFMVVIIFGETFITEFSSHLYYINTFRNSK